MAEVTLENVVKKFDRITVVKDLNLTVKDKEFIVLVGPSDCGKSTTLRRLPVWKRSPHWRIHEIRTRFSRGLAAFHPEAAPNSTGLRAA